MDRNEFLPPARCGDGDSSQRMGVLREEQQPEAGQAVGWRGSPKRISGIKRGFGRSQGMLRVLGEALWPWRDRAKLHRESCALGLCFGGLLSFGVQLSGCLGALCWGSALGILWFRHSPLPWGSFRALFQSQLSSFSVLGLL